MEYTIKPLPPFDFKKMLQRIAATGETYSVQIDLSAQTYRRFLRMENKLITLEVTFEGKVEQPVLRLHVPEKLSYNDQTAVVNLARRMFSVDVDLHKFYNHLEQQDVLKKIIPPNYGLRCMLDPSLFESLMKTIISQQLNLSFARTLINRLMQACADDQQPFATATMEKSASPTKQERALLPFPTPEQIANLTYEKLQSLGFSRKKAEYVIDTARMVAQGSLDLERLRKISDEEVMKSLLPIRGVGRWTVECFLVFGLGRPCVLPAADIGLRNAVKKVYGLNTQPSEQDVRQLGQAWFPWQTYTTLYLWESLHTLS